MRVYFFYYYPIGVDVRTQGRPWLSWSIAALCLGIFLADGPLAGVLPWQLSEFVYRPAAADPLAPLASIFLHASWLHLTGNLIYFLTFAPALEYALGRGGFLLVFLGIGYLGNLLQGTWVLQTHPEFGWVGIVGASGAISGMLGMFFLRFPWSRVRLAYWAFMPLQGVNRVGVREVPVAAALFLWVLLQAVQWWVFHDSARVAYAAHLGGLGTGLLLAIALGLSRRAHQDGLRHSARRASHEGDVHLAVADLGRYLELVPDDLDAWLDFARALRVADDRAGASRIYRRVLIEIMQARGIEQALEIYREARRADQVFHLDPEGQAEIAFWLEKAGLFADSVRAQLDFARFHGGHPGRMQAMARASTLLVARVGDRRQAIEVLEDALADTGDHPLRIWMQGELRRLQGDPVYA